MRKIVFLLSFLAFALADENDWLNQWTSPSTAPKATQSGIKSVAYYKQNKGEARKMARECLIKTIELEEQLEKFKSGAEALEFLINEMGETLYQNCQNARNALGE